MIPRRLRQQIEKQLERYPAVALLGPRQCGKTTLARFFKGKYFDLELESDRLRLDLDWENVLSTKELVILDEAQAWPEIFPRLRSAIDLERKRMGRFLILGSVSPFLMKEVSESLAGRLSLAHLTPFLLEELEGTILDDLWLLGGYPDGGILDEKQFPHWQNNYIALLTSRDLPNWGLPARPQTTERLLRMLAAVHGQAWNASRIGQSIGLNYQTVNSYMDYLEGCYLIRRLPPFRSNLSKRLVKTPKVYWRDTGLLHATLRVGNFEALLAQPWVGASWEGFVIEQALGQLQNVGRTFDAFFFRTSDQYEIDLVVDFGSELLAVEAKLTSNPMLEDVQKLNKTADLIGAHTRVLVSRTSNSLQKGNCVSANLPFLLSWLSKAS